MKIGTFNGIDFYKYGSSFWSGYIIIPEYIVNRDKTLTLNPEYVRRLLY